MLIHSLNKRFDADNINKVYLFIFSIGFRYEISFTLPLYRKIGKGISPFLFESNSYKIHQKPVGTLAVWALQLVQ